MKILLFGEISGVHKNLKEGLAELGYNDVVIATTGHGWRKIYGDIFLGTTKSKNIIKRIERLILPLLKIKSLINYDVVQFTGPYFFVRKQLHRYNKTLIKYVAKKNTTSFLIVAGCNGINYETAKRLEYSPCDPCKEYDQNDGRCIYESRLCRAWEVEIATLVDGIIPLAYEYAEGYRHFPNIKKTIFLPVNISKISYRENKVRNKLVIFHGINRVGFKGTFVIEKALKKIKEKYPNDVEVIIDGKMPLDAYLEILERANIVVDQTNSYSYGMNAVYSMAMGKVVLSGCEHECLNEFGIQESPIINIRPDEKDVISNIEFFIENRHRVSEVGRKSREFVEQNHDSVKVAQRLIEIWSETLSAKK